MAAGTPILDQHILNTEFHISHVVHTVRVEGKDVSTTWEEVKRIGGGGFGSVGLEKSAIGGREFLRAVKRLSRDLYVNLNLDFRREIQALVAVQDRLDLFVKFFGWYYDKHFFFIAMEYTPHGDLGCYIKEFRKDALLHAPNITRQLLEALSVLHERNICHRDLKPQNVLIASISPLRVKVADFGSSKILIGSRLRTRCGTVGYSAPEMLGYLPRHLVNTYAFALDMWALGCLVHEILTGEIPFLEEDPNRTHQDSMSGYGIQAPMEVTTDPKLLAMFCSGEATLPTDILKRSNADREAIGFIKGLLVADPRSRMSAPEALKHTWLAGFKPPIASKGAGNMAPKHQPGTLDRFAHLYTQYTEVDSTSSIPSTNNDPSPPTPQFLFRAFHTGDFGQHHSILESIPFRDYISVISELQESSDHSDQKLIASVFNTFELLYAINIANSLQNMGKSEVSIAIIDFQACQKSGLNLKKFLYHIGNPNAMESNFVLLPRILENWMVGCYSLNLLVNTGLYNLVPELCPVYKEVRFQDLKAIIKKSNRWKVGNKLSQVEDIADKVSKCFEVGSNTTFISSQVVQWWIDRK